MANKRNNTETGATDVAFRKVSIGKARGLYRRFGTKIRIGRSTYTINFCDFLFYCNQPCDGLCDTVNKIIYVQHQVGNEQAMQATLLHELLHASLAESTVTALLDWSDHMEEIIVESITRDLGGLYQLRIQQAHKPS